MENQEKVWDDISHTWKMYRSEEIKEVSEFLKNKTGKILDLGCGSGRNFVKLQGFYNGEDSCIYGVDFSQNMLDYARAYANKKGFNVKLKKSSALDLPFANNFFDSAICVAVLHCIPDAEKKEMALRELFRVLKSGAEAWISVWDKNQKKFKKSGKEITIPWKYAGREYMRYYYLYDKNEFADLLEKVGFEVLKANNSENPDGFYSKKNIDVVVRKPISS